MNVFKKFIILVLQLVFIGFWLLFILLPIFTIIINSFKTSSNFYQTQGLELPTEISFENYYEVLFETQFLNSFTTSVLLVVVSVIMTTIFSSAVAYVLERFNFKLKSFVNGLLFIVSVIPMIVMQVFVFQILNAVSLYDNIIGIALLYSISDIIVIYVFREQINKISVAIDKSARLYGATYIQIFTRIILPSLKSAIMVVTILKTIVVYNDFYLQFLYLPTNQTVSTYLYRFVGGYSISLPQICAMVVLSLLPTFLLVIVSRKYFKVDVSSFDL